VGGRRKKGRVNRLITRWKKKGKEKKVGKMRTVSLFPDREEKKKTFRLRWRKGGGGSKGKKKGNQVLKIYERRRGEEYRMRP